MATSSLSLEREQNSSGGISLPVGLNNEIEYFESDFFQKFERATAQYAHLPKMIVMDFVIFHIFKLIQQDIENEKSRNIKSQKIATLNDFLGVSYRLTMQLQVNKYESQKIKMTVESDITENIKECQKSLLSIIEYIETGNLFIQNHLLGEAFDLMRRLLLNGDELPRLKFLASEVRNPLLCSNLSNQTPPAKNILLDLKVYVAFQRYFYAYPQSRSSAKCLNFIGKAEFSSLFTGNLSSRQVMEKCALLAFQTIPLNIEFDQMANNENDLTTYLSIQKIRASMTILEDLLLSPLHYSPKIAFKNFLKNMIHFSTQELMACESKEYIHDGSPLGRLREDLSLLRDELSDFIQTTINSIFSSEKYQSEVESRLKRAAELNKNDQLNQWVVPIKMGILQNKCLFPLREKINSCFQRIQTRLEDIKKSFFMSLESSDEPLDSSLIETEVVNLLTSLVAIPISIIMDARKLNGDAYAAQNDERNRYPEVFLALASLEGVNFSKRASSRTPQVEEPLTVDAPPLREEKTLPVTNGETSASTSCAHDEETCVEIEEPSENLKEYLSWEDVLEEFYPELTKAKNEAKLLRILKDDFVFVRQKGSHKTFQNIKTNVQITFAAHSETDRIPLGTFNEYKKSIGFSILRQLEDKLQAIDEKLLSLQVPITKSKHKEKKRLEEIGQLQADREPLQRKIQILEERLR